MLLCTDNTQFASWTPIALTSNLQCFTVTTKVAKALTHKPVIHCSALLQKYSLAAVKSLRLLPQAILVAEQRPACFQPTVYVSLALSISLGQQRRTNSKSDGLILHGSNSGCAA